MQGTHDISAERELIEALREAKSQAEESARTKADFLANMSHEIRTPMNAIIGMSHLALQTDLDAQQRDYVRKISAAANNLLTIINDILDFSKIEAGQLQFEHAPFALQEVIEHILDLSLPTAEDKGLKLSVEIAPTVPARLIGDALRLGQVLLNLVSNALKFTERGRIRLSVASIRESAEHLWLRFEVADTGIGLTSAQCDKLFTAFSQADASTTRRYGGTGLGLTISRHLVEQMEGEIGVDSRPGVGSSFYFTARLGRDGSPPNAASSPPPVLEDQAWRHHLAACRRSLRGARLLLVEDYEINRELILGLLSDIDAQIDVAANGAEAVRMARQADYDGVLMDCQMPVMDGFEATRRIRRDPRLATLPILAMTANAMSGDRERCLASGMNDHIAKPIEVESFYRILGHWIEPRVRDAEIGRPPPAAGEPAQAPVASARPPLRPEDRRALERLLARLAEELRAGDSGSASTASVLAGVLRSLREDAGTDRLIAAIQALEYAPALDHLRQIAAALEIALD